MLLEKERFAETESAPVKERVQIQESAMAKEAVQIQESAMKTEEGKEIPLIRVENLKKYYPVKGGIITHTTGYVKAVDGVGFSVMRGQTLGLVGDWGGLKKTK